MTSRHELFTVAIAVTMSWVMCTPAGAQDNDDGDSETANLVVMVRGPKNGAGIIFALQDDILYIATASHVVRSGGSLPDVQVMLRLRPGQWLPARLTEHFDASQEIDLAVLAVHGIRKLGIQFCDLPIYRLARTEELKRGDEVYPIGYPNAVSWGMPVAPDRIADKLGTQLTFQSAFITNGHSGGGLVTGNGELAGMIVADAPPFGRATDIGTIVRQLRKWGYPVQLHEPWPLHRAAVQGHTSELRGLLQTCPNLVNSRLGERTKEWMIREATPLHLAAHAKQADAVRVLLEHGADPLLKVPSGKSGATALEIAVASSAADVARLLLEHIRRKRMKVDGLGRLFSWSGVFNIPMMSVLLDYAKHVGYPDNIRETLLNEVAAWKYHRGSIYVNSAPSQVAAAKLLIQHGADVNRPDEDGRTALHAAVTVKFGYEQENVELVRILVSHGANVNHIALNGRTPLHEAAACKCQEIVRILLQHGAKVNVVDDRGQTPLHDARTRLYNHYGGTYYRADDDDILPIVKLLVDAGAR